MVTSERRLTLEEFLALPEEKPALELREGMVTQKVPPQIRHARLQSKLAELVNRFAEPAELAVAFTEMRAVFGSEAHVPDPSVYRWARLPFGEDDELPDRFEESPDIAIEIVSPDQRVTGLIEKCLIYVAHSTAIALIVDPEDKLILDIRPGGRIQALRGTDRINLSTVLPDFELSVDAVFALLRRPCSGRPVQSDQ